MSEFRRRRTSDIWNYFEIVGTSTASCNMCKSVLSFKSTNSNLRKHIERKHVLVLDHLVPTEKSSNLSEECGDAAETSSLPEPSSPEPHQSGTVYSTIYAESLADLPDPPAEKRATKKTIFKRPYKERPTPEEDRLGLNSIIYPKNGSKDVAKTLQDLADAQVASNSLKEQQLIVEKNRNEIFSHFLTIFKNMTEKNYSNHSSRAGRATTDCSSPTSTPYYSRKQEIDEDGPTAFKYPRTREPGSNDNLESEVNLATDLEIEERKIEIEERRLKLEERKIVMEGQMEERKIAMEEKKIKLDGQKVTSGDQPEERKLEIDEAQMILNEQKFMLEVQIEEKKLEIEEKRLKLEKRKVFLNKQRKKL